MNYPIKCVMGILQMILKKINIWYISSFLISLAVSCSLYPKGTFHGASCGYNDGQSECALRCCSMVVPAVFGMWINIIFFRCSIIQYHPALISTSCILISDAGLPSPILSPSTGPLYRHVNNLHSSSRTTFSLLSCCAILNIN